MINRTILVGRLTKDPELRRTQSGKNTCSYTLAVNRKVKTNGQDADFIACVAWDKTAEFMAKYLHKGSLIGVEGRIQTHSYENHVGQRIYVTEVVTDNVQFLEPRGQQPQEQPQYQQPQNTYQQPHQQTFAEASDEVFTDEDLPF